MSSGDKRKHRHERRQDGLKNHTPEDIDRSEEDKISNIYNKYASDSSTRRTPTPTKQITLQAIKRKPEYSQNESNSSSHQRAPPLIRPNSGSRRTPTPTKHITLQAIRRKSDNYSDLGSCDPKEYNSICSNDVVLVSSSKVKDKQRMADSLPQQDRSSSQIPSSSSSSSSGSIATQSSASIATTVASQKVAGGQMSKVKDQENKSVTGGKRTSFNDVTNISDSDQYDTDLSEEDDSSDDDEDDEPLRAPNELLMEFLACIMQKDYENAQKLCKMILLYEPENPEALSFQPLIQHKIERAQAGEETSSSDDDTDDSGDDSGDADSADSHSNEDSGEESADNSSKESSEDNENEEENGDDDDDDGDDNDDEDEENDDDDDDDDEDRVTDSGLGSVTDMTH